VYFALGAAALTFIITHNIIATIAVIIVAGACGIAAGTPLAVLGAVGRAARGGAIVKGGRYLEALAKTDIVVLDKTGTLTYGKPDVRAILPVAGITCEVLLRLAAMAELRSEHPIGRAIVAHAASLGIAVEEPETFDYVPGRGIRAHRGVDDVLVGNRSCVREAGIALPVNTSSAADASEVFVAFGGRFVGTIQIADALRPEALGAVAELRRLSIRTVLLTGDVRRVAESVAETLAVD
jgi:P-type E1-E2 ATPase